MQFFPKVQSPCPYKGPLSDIMDGDVCRLCKREVHDLTAMAEDARRALFAGCSDEVCVTYRIDARPALAALAIGAGVMTPAAVAAQDEPRLAAASGSGYAAEDSGDRIMIVVGGARRDSVEWHSEADIRRDHPQRALPVVYEDEPASRDERASGSSAEPPKRA